MIRHASQHTTIEAIRKRMVAVSSEDDANYSRFTCISRHGKAGSIWAAALYALAGILCPISTSKAKLRVYLTMHGQHGAKV